jgi:hypothetical protein
MKIIVNGTEHEWSERLIAYADVSELAYPGRGYRELSMTYHWRGPGDLNRDGTLWATKPAIEAAEGMSFTAMHTGNA